MIGASPRDRAEAATQIGPFKTEHTELVPRQLRGSVGRPSQWPDYGDARDYADKMNEGDEFPPIHVTRTSSGKLVIGDGHHRATASGMIDKPVKAIVREGTPNEEAIAAAVAKLKRKR